MVFKLGNKTQNKTMPLIASNPWQDAASYGGGFGAQIAQMLAQQPQLRLQLAQAVQQGQLNQAKIGETGANTSYLNAQTDATKVKTDQERNQPGAISQALEALIQNNPHLFASTYGAAQGNAPKDVGGQLSMGGAMIGANPTMNPGLAAIIQGAKPTVVPANAIAYPPMGGAPQPGAELLRPGSSIQQPGGQMQVSPVAPPQRNDLGALGNLLGSIPKNVDSGMMDAGQGSNMLQQLILPALTNALRMQGQGEGLLQGQGQQSQPPKRISSQQEYDALPNGAQYVDDSGHTKTKGVK
jgi:hypothetical protein